MLEKAEGSICQATNLLKTFSNHPQGTKHMHRIIETLLIEFQLGLWVYWKKMPQELL
jgi:Ubiquitin carboxyl-terminal hydrolase